MTVEAGDIVRMTVNTLLPDSVIAQNVFYYLASAGVSETDDNVTFELNDNAEAAWIALDGLLNVNVEIGDCEFSISKDGGATFHEIGVRPMTGPNPNHTADMAPHGDAVIVRFGGIGTGRTSRKFIAGVSEDYFSRSTVITTGVTVATNWAVIMNNDIAVAGGTMQFGWLNKNPLGFTIHNGVIIVNAIVGYQRRRKPGVGI